MPANSVTTDYRPRRLKGRATVERANSGPLSVVRCQSSLKRDPYATKAHRQIDIALVVITFLLMLFAFRLSTHQRANENSNRAQQSHSKLANR